MRKILGSITLLLGLTVSTVAHAQSGDFNLTDSDLIGKRLGWTLHQTLADVYAEGVFRCEAYEPERNSPGEYTLGFVGAKGQMHLYYQLRNGRVVGGRMTLPGQMLISVSESFSEWWSRTPTSQGLAWRSPHSLITGVLDTTVTGGRIYLDYAPLPIVAKPQKRPAVSKK